MTWLALLGITMAAAVVFCVARGLVDLRDGRTAWGVTALAIAATMLLFLLFVPIPTHAVKMELPVNVRS